MFEGYWWCFDVDCKVFCDGWYLIGDIGFFDEEGDLFVIGWVDDMIIIGGENVLLVEVESCLLLYWLVDEVVVVGLFDECWGKVVIVFIRWCDLFLMFEMLDEYCKYLGLVNFCCLCSYVFVCEILWLFVGKLLCCCFVVGEYEFEKFLINV